MNPKLPYRASGDSVAAVIFDGRALVARGFLINSLDGIGVGIGYMEDFDNIVQPTGQEDPYGDKASRRTAL